MNERLMHSASETALLLKINDLNRLLAEQEAELEDLRDRLAAREKPMACESGGDSGIVEHAVPAYVPHEKYTHDVVYKIETFSLGGCREFEERVVCTDEDQAKKIFDLKSSNPDCWDVRIEQRSRSEVRDG